MRNSTGYMQALEAQLLFRLGLKESMQRTPLNGLGCAGGVAALAAAMTPTSLRPEVVVSAVAAGLPSLSFRKDDL